MTSQTTTTTRATIASLSITSAVVRRATPPPPHAAPPDATTSATASSQRRSIDEASPSTQPLVAADRPFRCTHPNCGAAFPKVAKLHRHLRSHSDERPFVCQHPGCGASYKRSEHLKVHQRRHQDDSQRRFECTEPGCGMTFWTSTHLKNHVQSVHRDEMLKVGSRSIHLPPSSGQQQDGASPSASTASAAASPAATESMPGLTEYRCTEPGCCESFHKRKVLRAHIREAHSDVAVAEVLRAVAEDDFQGALAADTAPPADVQQSGRQVGTVDDEELAQRILLPFPCSHDGCSMRFATNAKRRSHFKTHEEGRYTCSMPHHAPQHASQSSDGRSGTDGTQPGDGPHAHLYIFPNWSALREHMKERHPPTCPWPGCGKSFTRQDNLRAHYKRHEKRVADLEAESRLHSPSGAVGSPETLPGRSRSHSRNDDSGTDSSDDDGGVWQLLDAERRASSQSPVATSAERQDLEVLASDLSKNRPRRSSRLSTSDLSSAAGSASFMSQSDAAAASTSAPASDGSARFVCTWNGCGRTYTRKSGLAIHIRTRHLGECPFECPGCKHTFAHKHLVSRHRRTCSSMDPLAALRGAQLDKVEGRLTTLPDRESSRQEGHAAPARSPSPLGSASAEASEHEIEDAGVDDAEEDDDYFRREGGAVPEDDAERGHTGDPHKAYQKQPDSALKSRLLDLLTGKGYLSYCGRRADAGPSESQGAAAGEDRPAKRRRINRDRVFECPWQSIVEVVRSGSSDVTADGAANHTGNEPSEPVIKVGKAAPAPATGPDVDVPSCSYRFSRIYDLRRHLKASHGLVLNDHEIRAWLQTRQHADRP